jgi:hypothetical protein
VWKKTPFGDFFYANRGENADVFVHHSRTMKRPFPSTSLRATFRSKDCHTPETSGETREKTGVGMNKDLGRGRSRKQARRNKAMRRVLHDALDRLLEECMQVGWFGDMALHVSVDNGIVQREYRSFSGRLYRL